MPGFSVAVTLLAGFGGWSLRRVGPWSTAGIAVAGAMLVTAGLAVDVGWLMPVGLLVASAAVGSLGGRLLPAGPGPMAVLLAALAAADIVWIVAGGGAGGGFPCEIANLSISIGSATGTIGTIDVVLAALVAAHWAARGGSVWVAVAAAPFGMVLANVFVAVTGATNLPLVPFIAVGWAATEAWHRRRRGTRPVPGD